MNTRNTKVHLNKNRIALNETQLEDKRKLVVEFTKEMVKMLITSNRFLKMAATGLVTLALCLNPLTVLSQEQKKEESSKMAIKPHPRSVNKEPDDGILNKKTTSKPTVKKSTAKASKASPKGKQKVTDTKTSPAKK
jgi:hypothetical protein